jgi:hypothetical protein
MAMTRAFWNPICAYYLNKVLKNGTLPRKRPSQKQYQQPPLPSFLVFLEWEKIKSKRRYSREKMQINREFRMFSIEMVKNHFFSTNMNITHSFISF